MIVVASQSIAMFTASFPSTRAPVRGSSSTMRMKPKYVPYVHHKRPVVGSIKSPASIASQSSSTSEEATSTGSVKPKSGDIGSSVLFHIVSIRPACPPPSPPPVELYATRYLSPIFIASGAAPPPGRSAPGYQFHPSSEMRPPPPVPNV